MFACLTTADLMRLEVRGIALAPVPIAIATVASNVSAGGNGTAMRSRRCCFMLEKFCVPVTYTVLCCTVHCVLR